MVLTVICSRCDQRILAPEDLAGLGANCPTCGERIEVPAAARLDAWGAPVSTAPAPSIPRGMDSLPTTKSAMVSADPRPRALPRTSLWAGLIAMSVGAVLGMIFAMAIIHTIVQRTPAASGRVASEANAAEDSLRLRSEVPNGR